MPLVCILGTDDFNLAQLKAVPGAADCRFHTLAAYDEIRAGPDHPVREVLERARRSLQGLSEPVDAIVGWWDFPVSTMLPILRREAAVPGPTLESVLACEHKFWSRMEQLRCIPEHVPQFAALDPFADDAALTPPLPYPFWLKPVKSASSYLGFRIDDGAALARALGAIRRHIHRLAEPFNHILEHAHLPSEVAAVDGWHCIAEEIISRGRQCTLEGYVQDGRTTVYGVVDSMRQGRHRSSFSRYQYPSAWPRRVQARAIAITARFLEHIGYDDSPFNAEFFWEPEDDRLWLLEVNTRISKSHAPLFRLVDGVSHHQVALAVALGRRPDFPHREGSCRLAAKFMLRRFRDALVLRVPTAQDIGALRRTFAGAEVELHVHEGMRLSQLGRQDSYSYEVAVLFLGADSQRELLADYRRAVDMLNFAFSA